MRKNIFLQSMHLFFLGFCCTICQIPSPQEWMEQPDWSPDGKSLVYECYLEGPTTGVVLSPFKRWAENPEYSQPYYSSAAADICLNHIAEGQQIRLTSDVGGDWLPTWSPDGAQIAYKRYDGIYVMDADGLNKRRLVKLSALRDDEVKPIWSPDGTRLLFSACLKEPDEEPNYDVYVVNVHSETITNLTPNSKQQDVNPDWILDGAKIFFLSTASSSWIFDGSCTLEEDAPHEMKTINSDGSGEQNVYEQKLYYHAVSASNDGQIAFISDLTSKTQDERSRADRFVYKVELSDSQPIKLSRGPWPMPWLLDWSPNGKHLLYTDVLTIKVVNIETGEIRDIPEIDPGHSDIDWAPDSEQIVITGSKRNLELPENNLYIFNLKSDILRQLPQK